MGHSGYTHFTKVDVLNESPKAFKLRFYRKDKSITCVWVPKSLIADVKDYSVGDSNAEVSIKDWFVERERLED